MKAISKRALAGINAELDSRTRVLLSSAAQDEVEGQSLSAAVNNIAFSETLNGLASEGKIGNAIPMLEDIYNRLDVPPTVCGAGCAFCCHSLVSVHPGELFLIIFHLRQKYGDEQMVQIGENILRVAGLVAGLDGGQRWRKLIKCPLLADDNTCTTYEARPVACWGYVSRSLRDCRTSFITRNPDYKVESLMVRVGMAGACVMGARSALGQLDLQSDEVELIGGLAVVLTTPNAYQRWLDGERLFTPFVVEPIKP